MGVTAQPLIADEVSLQQESALFVAGCGNDSCRSLPPPPNPAYPPVKPSPSKPQPENQTAARYFQQRSREIEEESSDAGAVRKPPLPADRKPKGETKMVRYYQKRDSRLITEEEEQNLTPPPKGAWKNNPNGTRTWQNDENPNGNSSEGLKYNPGGEIKGYSNGNTTTPSKTQNSPNSNAPKSSNDYQPEMKPQTSTYRPNTWYNGAK